MSQTNIIWDNNGLSYELDMQDAETSERYESAFSKMAEREKLLPKDGASSAYIRAYHELFKNLFDDIFGEGSGSKIVGEKANSRVCNEVYASFLDFVAEQKNSQMEFNNNLVSRYSANRAQRRAAK